MPNLFDNQRLYDIALYNSVMLESVKLYEFNARLVLFRRLKKDLEDVLYKVKYDNLGFMQKKEVNALIKKVQKINEGFYNSVSRDVQKMFESFAARELVAQKKKWSGIALAMDSGEDEKELTEAQANKFIEEQGRKGWFPLALLIGAGSLFADKLLTTPMNGFGQTLPTVLKKYNELSNKRLEDLVLKAWGSDYTREQMAHEILGDPSVKQGKKGALGTMRAQMDAIIDTSIGFAAEQAHAAVTSAVVSEKYIWISVMDGRTSAICIDRNRKIYEVGKGPLPPAHANCRSSTAPYRDNQGTVDNQDFETWVSKQDSDTQKNIKKYGIIDPSTGKYKATKPLSPDEFFNQGL